METKSTNTENNGNFLEITWHQVYEAANDLYKEIEKYPFPKVFAIPRGGVYAALALKLHFPHIEIMENPQDADFFIDDIYDSGATARKWNKRHDKPVYWLFKREPQEAFYEFPWERANGEDGPMENISRIFQYIGEDATREGLKETPKRIVKSWDKLYGGYKELPEACLKIFTEDTSDEMVVLKDIEFYSTCEHHMLPFFGKAHIAYIPNGKVVGISKLARVLEVYSRRLQIQERLCQEISSCIMTHLEPLGVACLLEAQHFCMTARGVEKQHSIMITSSLEGAFKEKPETRAEFMSLIGK